jgi:citrate/tricarballylate utilization protein
MAELRLQTYEEFVWPKIFRGLFERNGLAVSLTTILVTLLVIVITLFSKGSSVFFGTHVNAGAFYEVIPFMAMVLPFSILGLAILVCLVKSVGIFWQKTGGKMSDLLNVKAHLHAISDALKLKYLEGGGHGCNYPDDRFSMIRRNFHHAIFYGFLLCLASTTIALIYDHFLHLQAPYPFWSWPVFLGTLGGLSITIGTGGMLILKCKMDKKPSTPKTAGMDISFTTLLLFTAVTGLLLLFFRATPLMGLLLTVHLGLVASLFITMPFGKFLHVVYRYMALVRNAIEQEQEGLVQPKRGLIDRLKALTQPRGANR